MQDFQNFDHIMRDPKLETNDQRVYNQPKLVVFFGH